MIAEDLACALDPVRWAERATGFTLDAWSRDALRSTQPRQCWNVTRQGSKSTTAALLAVWTALYRPGSLTILVSPSLRQSCELLRRCLDIYRAVSHEAPSDAETLTRLELVSGSRILSLPGSEGTIRGLSAPALIAIDEASRVEDALLAAITPMQATATAGRLLALSTPAAAAGGGEPGRTVATIGSGSWSEPPTCRASRPTSSSGSVAPCRPRPIRQEYECSFEEADAAVFAADAVSQAIDPEREPLRLDAFRRWTA